ncbi:sulfatase [Pontiella agarivorans]|uniref:Sulfatase n=1 Tax=Pontiella agarivorans TaxID=3038953 RepID=A0ABU5MZW9_9BACT|nr:sulfatase [Pontiella agarivorans]MDZ8119735.1 sulfatase [Pontiella agarivorans]
MKKIVLKYSLVFFAAMHLAAGCFGAERPNILMIAIDDINDWIGPLGGHPQAKTPELDRFCAGGAMVFKNAVCAAPICGPSRSAVLSGFLPSTTGVYGNGHNMIFSEIVKTHATLPEYFTQHGYYTLSNGKIFHKHGIDGKYTDFGHWAWDEHARARRGVNNRPDKAKLTAAGAGIINGISKPEYKGKAKLSWGPTQCGFEEMVDYKVAAWTEEVLQRDFEKPFFIASGIIKPHLPWYVPQQFFDLYDLESIQPPEVKEDDLDDILTPKGKKAFKPSGEYEWIKKHGLEKDATRAYLASISFADACVGKMLRALENSQYADNTIVVIWGDHGWHLGEKQRFLKNTTWNETAKTPFIVKIPGMKKPLVCDRTVSLIDIYPTLVSLCGLPEKELDGLDFSPLLKNPETAWDRPGITVTSAGTSVMGERWHYALQLDGTEELYDLQNDPMEWTNLINSPEYAAIAARMKKWVPETRAAGKFPNHKKPKNYVDADAAPGIKATRDLSRLK